tara:strand:+ start:573 stop:842 length:270 start_codon:yes stop_codon:yes gene_type:complete
MKGYNLKIIYTTLLFMLVNCGAQDTPDIEVAKEQPIERKTKYKTYKNQVPIMNTGREKLEKLSNVNDATRNILKTFDTHKSKISSSSGE